jgi:Nucleotide-diphospho-sugar transferase
LRVRVLHLAAVFISALHCLAWTCHRNMRNNGTKFRQLATQKPRIVNRLFQTYGFETIILSDTDTVWLRDPTGARLS